MYITVLRGPLDNGPFTLHPGDNIAGRSEECDVCLPSKRVSRHHCVFTVSDGRVDVRDLGSHNGIIDGATGRRVASLALLPGGCIQVGDYLLLLELDADDANTEEQADDDVMIATSEIEGPQLEDLEEADLHWADGRDDEAVEDFDEELSLDDTASAIRAANLSPGMRPPPARERTQPSPLRPLAEVAPMRRPTPLPAPPGASLRGDSGAARGGWRPTVRSDNTAPRLDAREEPPPRPVLLPVEDPTPRQVARPDPAWRARLAASPDEDVPTAVPLPRAPDPRPAGPRAPEVRPPDTRSTSSPPTVVRSARPEVRAPSEPPSPRISPAQPRHEPRPTPRAEPRVVTAVPVAPRSPARSPAPEVNEARATGVPWLLQVIGLLMLTLAVAVCAPVGGLASQVRTQSNLAHEASVRQAVETARVLAARNATVLEANTGGSVDLSLVAGNPGVRDARLCDTRGTVLAPADKARLSLGAHTAMARAMATGASATAETDTGTVEIVVPIRATAGGPVVGYAWLDYDPDVVASTLANPWIGAFATVLVAGALWTLLLALVWWTAARPAASLAQAAERLASGRSTAVSPPTRSDSWERIARSLNELAARARERNEG